MKSTLRRSVLVSLLTGLLVFGPAAAANDSNAYTAALLTEMGISGVTVGDICSTVSNYCYNGVVYSINLEKLPSRPRGLPDHTVAPFNTFNYEEMTIREISCPHCDLPWGSLPAAWGRIKTLETIDFPSGGLEGTLPPEWSGLTQIVNVMLENNRLTGTLPPEWSSMAGLERLELSYNSLTGTLPPEWSSMPSLRYLEISANRIYGSIPPEWKYLSDLRGVDLSVNLLTGTLPAQWSNMPKLSQLFFNDNRLSGSIPESYTTQTFPSLTAFRMEKNPQMTGCVPPSWRDTQDVFHYTYTFLVEDKSPLASDSCTTKSDKGGLSTGAIVGIVVGSVVALLMILFLVIFLCCCRKDKKDTKRAAAAGGCATSAPQAGRKELSTNCYSYYDDLH